MQVATVRTVTTEQHITYLVIRISYRCVPFLGENRQRRDFAQ